VILEILDHKVQLALLAQLAQQAHKVHKVKLVQLVQQEQLVLQGQQALMQFMIQIKQ
jgi:hypothetical protein